jgi:uncharacterized protein YdeI (YjbR/CyaY-like superfamily)
MTPIFFTDASAFRSWLIEYHENEKEVLVGYYKVDSGKPSMTWSQSVDEALCFGWIDGIRRSIDKESYCIRFTPRKPTSIWSAVNIEKVEKLKKAGLMLPAGLKAYSYLSESKSRVYSFENAAKKLDERLETAFKSNQKAWDFFSTQAPSYQKAVIHWIMSAKQETTILSRLEKLIQSCSQLKRL